MIIKIQDANGEEIASPTYSMINNGVDYVEFTAETSGTAYIRLYNYYDLDNIPNHYYSFSINKICNIKGHTPIPYGAKSATCTTKGLTAGTKCSECGTIIKQPTTIPKLKPTIKLSKSKITLKIGKTQKIKVTMANGDSVKSWKSNKPKIASVNAKGVIKAKKKGNATITVKLKSGKKATVKVTVQASKTTSKKPASTKPTLSLSIPTAPLTLHNYSYDDSIESTYVLTKIAYKAKYDKDAKEYNISLIIKGKKTYDYRGRGQSDDLAISWKLYKGNTVVKSGTEYSESLAMGEQFEINNEIVYGLKSGKYVLKILSTN